MTKGFKEDSGTMLICLPKSYRYMPIASQRWRSPLMPMSKSLHTEEVPYYTGDGNQQCQNGAACSTHHQSSKPVRSEGVHSYNLPTQGIS